ncbi:MAG: hypothetical protein PHY08_01825 [Candidatus Cloacimonetes bacterium]|nr:hypothetical protein [Candidatus Cloacimonadota bacterium]
MKKFFYLIIVLTLISVGCCNSNNNNVPIIEDIHTDLRILTQTDTIYISCTAFDPDNDEISYSWYLNNELIIQNKSDFLYAVTHLPDYYVLKVEVKDIKGAKSKKEKLIYIVNDYNTVYSNAVVDAQNPEESDIINTLTAVTADNPNIVWENTPGKSRVLVTTNTKYSTSYIPNIGNEMDLVWGETWVFFDYEAINIINNKISNEKNMLTRLKQLLGLPPDSDNTYIVEMWVETDDLKRPSKDNEIYDSQSDLSYPVDADSSWINWFNNLVATQYGENPYPWTQLGYTYDWGNPESKIGISEFIIMKNSTVKIENVYTVEEYFNQRIKNK